MGDSEENEAARMTQGLKTEDKVLRVEEEIGTTVRPPFRRSRCFKCVGLTAAAIVALVLVIVILVFTLFKPRDPRIKLESVTLTGLQFGPGAGSLLPSVNMSLEVTVAVKNPNHASFKYKATTTRFYYRETAVGEAPLPGAELDADKTDIQVTMVVIQVDRFLSSDPSNLVLDVLRGELPFSTKSEVDGYVNVLNVYKHHAHGIAQCDMVIFLGNQTVGAMKCDYNVDLH